MRRWRAANPERARELRREGTRRHGARWYAERRAKFDALKNGPCTDCGGTFPPYVMQWDHRDSSQKEFTIGQTTTLAWERYLAEIAKCDLVCANCHAIRTHERHRTQAA
jgi:hypothetical protein